MGCYKVPWPTLRLPLTFTLQAAVGILWIMELRYMTNCISECFNRLKDTFANSETLRFGRAFNIKWYSSSLSSNATCRYKSKNWYFPLWRGKLNIMETPLSWPHNNWLLCLSGVKGTSTKEVVSWRPKIGAKVCWALYVCFFSQAAYLLGIISVTSVFMWFIMFIVLFWSRELCVDGWH